MKIAIQANHNRGKEIISLLESLGSTKTALSGDGDLYTYYIDENHVIRYGDPPIDYKLYTLEEFEKEFPFKVGDKVIFPVEFDWWSGTITSLTSDFKYQIKTEKRGYLYIESHKLSLYTMKKERNITLTLDKAKEWYKKGGELKEIALQAFTEKELIKVDLPKTWEEFCNTHPTKKGEYYIDNCSDISSQCESTEGRDIEMDKNVCPSKQSAEAHLALMQLEQLRDCYRGLFVTVIGMPIWNISMYNGKPHIIQAMWGKNHSFLSFQSKEVAEEYLKNFKPLIEKAGDLI